MKQTDKIQKLIQTLNKSGVSVFPTETFYGLGCAVDDLESSLRISELKGSRENRPFPVICADVSQIDEWCEFPPGDLREMLLNAWPAPLAVLLKLRDDKISLVAPQSHENNFSAVRISSNRVVTEIAKKLHRPIVATSANSTGASPPSKIKDVEPHIIQAADYIFDGGTTPGGLPSTIIKPIIQNDFEIIRTGAYKFK